MTGFTDRDGRRVDVPEPPPSGSHYAAIGRFQGQEYRRNAFARGTGQEAGVLATALDLPSGAVILDVGCGNGRHVSALRALGYRAVGLDLAPEVLAGGDAAADGAVVAGRAQQLPFADGSMDGLISVCQGGFGITPAQDDLAVGEWYRVLRTGGSVALTAFSLVYASRFMVLGEAIDVERGLHHHLADVRGPDGERRSFDLWTAAYSVPHLCGMLDQHGFTVVRTAGVEPGDYQIADPPSVTDPEVLVVAKRR